MATVGSFLKLQRIVLPNFAANAALGTAAATVDVASSFTINQTAAGIAVTLPSPTTTTDMQMLYIQNIGTASITVGGVVIPASKYVEYTWNGTAWVAQADTSPAKFYVQQALTAGNNTITHNLALGTPKAVQVTVIEDVSGETVIPKIAGATMLTNSLVINVVAAVPLANITVVG
jgi:hypothetical protein